MMDAHEILAEAAADATEAYEFNKDRDPDMRISRCGLPLLQLVMEDIVIPKLPKIADESRTFSRKVNSSMAPAVGYVYEKAVAKHLKEERPGYDFFPQLKLSYKGLLGTADLVLINNAEKKVAVIECKALGVGSMKEGKETKLFTDSWGYYSQLQVYMAAAEETYPGHLVEGFWFLWAKKISKSFIVNCPFDQQTVDKAVKRTEAYTSFKGLLSAKDIKGSIYLLSIFNDPVTARSFMFGNLCHSCGFHFNPWSAALLDEDGFLLPNWKANLEILLNVAFCEDNPKKALNLLTTSTDYLYS